MAVARLGSARGRFAGAAVCLCTALGPVCAAADDAATPKRGGWDPALIQQWMAALERHTPGAIDGALLEAALWSNQDLDRIWADVQLLVQRSLNPRRTKFKLAGRDSDARTRGSDETITIKSRDEPALKALVARVQQIGGVNAMLKRGVLLHTDVATLAPETAAAAARTTTADTAVKTLVGDGDVAGTESLSAHWTLSRMLVSTLVPDPRAHDFARDWYRATVAQAQSKEFWDSIHLGRGLELFPDDPVLQWLKGCQHEAYATPLYQTFIQSFAYRRIRPEISDKDAELDRAERAFRRALAGDATLVETRLRLGRVLALKGRRDEAVRELDEALAHTRDRTVEYYGRLFLGAEHQAAGRLQAARAQYRRAVAITPDARIPYLALAQIARELGDRDDMLTQLDRALAPLSADTPIDPWWNYRASQGRHAAAWMETLRRTWQAGPR